MDEPPRKRYKIILDRPNCIGAGSCVIAYEQRWKMNTDDKVDLIGGKEEQPGQFILECTKEEFEKFLESAQVCPVNVIHIFDLETGKQLI